MNHSSIGNPNPELVDGEAITLGKQALVLPPIPLVKVPTLEPIMSGHPNPLSSPEYVEAFMGGLYWSLRRNYPDINREWVENQVDLVAFPVLLDKFLVVNGFKKDAPAGEVLPQ
jgi:hypothetical protein